WKVYGYRKVPEQHQTTPRKGKGGVYIRSAYDVAARALLHVLDDIIPELGALDLRGPGHLAGKIVRDPFGANGAVQAFEDQLRRLVPAQVTEHHFATQNH